MTLPAHRDGPSSPTTPQQASGHGTIASFTRRPPPGFSPGIRDPITTLPPLRRLPLRWPVWIFGVGPLVPRQAGLWRPVVRRRSGRHAVDEFLEGNLLRRRQPAEQALLGLADEGDGRGQGVWGAETAIGPLSSPFGRLRPPVEKSLHGCSSASPPRAWCPRSTTRWTVSGETALRRPGRVASWMIPSSSMSSARSRSSPSRGGAGLPGGRPGACARTTTAATGSAACSEPTTWAPTTCGER